MKLLELQSIDNPLNGPLLLATDSSINVGSRPVFLPEISDRWLMEISPAFRICRLGKTISERFAPRYYDAFTLAARLLPLDLMDELAENGMRYSPLTTAFDGAISLGTWLPLDSLKSEGELTLYLSSPARNMEIKLDEQITKAADKAIAFLSRSFILKNGDVIVPGGPITEFKVEIDNRIEVSSDREKLLAFNIK